MNKTFFFHLFSWGKVGHFANKFCLISISNNLYAVGKITAIKFVVRTLFLWKIKGLKSSLRTYLLTHNTTCGTNQKYKSLKYLI